MQGWTLWVHELDLHGSKHTDTPTCCHTRTYTRTGPGRPAAAHTQPLTPPPGPATEALGWAPDALPCGDMTGLQLKAAPPAPLCRHVMPHHWPSAFVRPGAAPVVAAGPSRLLCFPAPQMVGPSHTADQVMEPWPSHPPDNSLGWALECLGRGLTTPGWRSGRL